MILEQCIVHTRAEKACLSTYLTSRSCAGCTGNELIQSIGMLSEHIIGSFHTFNDTTDADAVEVKVKLSSVPVAARRSRPKMSLTRPDALTINININTQTTQNNTISLIDWIVNNLSIGNAMIATLNLQLFGNDAWHHQFIYGITLNDHENDKNDNRSDTKSVNISYIVAILLLTTL